MVRCPILLLRLGLLPLPLGFTTNAPEGQSCKKWVPYTELYFSFLQLYFADV